MERNIKLVLEYDGTGLAGWQRQSDRPTIQSLLEDALSKIVNQPVKAMGSGRTDAGVHARGQVVNFKTTSDRSCEDIVRGGNAVLPRRVAILSARDVPADFNARFSAISKIYDYDLLVSPVRSSLMRHYVWHLKSTPDFGAMEKALSHLIGRHDFASFQSTGTAVHTTVRTMARADLTLVNNGLVRITLQADGFLRHMVRAIVGTVVQVGWGKMSPDEFKAVMESADRSQAGQTAPAQGLFLREVIY